MSTRQDVIDAYDSLLFEMATNPFIDAYIKFKTKSKLRYHFLNVMNNLGTSVDDYSVTWKNSIKYVEWYNESVTADECLLSIQTIRDYLTFLEQVINEKVESTVDPQPTDNTYSIGSMWINTATDSYFILTSIVLGVATWTPSGGGGAGTGDITGSGTAGRIALWDANKNITSDGELLYDSTNDILTVVNISHTGNYKENVIVVNSDTTLGNTHSHIVCVNGASEITLPTITSANVKIRYNLKNISTNVVNITTDGTQKFDGDVITDLTLGVGNQITLVATEISTGEFSWITFN